MMDRRRFVDPRQINSSVDELHGPLAHMNLFQGHEVGLEYGENAANCRLLLAPLHSGVSRLARLDESPSVRPH